MKKVLVFGIFDKVHKGHIDFFRQAKKHGDVLIVAVGQPAASREIKSKLPKYSLKERIKFVQDSPNIDKAAPGDKALGSYKIVESEKPDIICLGYDQKALAEDLRQWMQKNDIKIPLKFLKPYKPDVYHTGILDGR